MFQRYVLSNHVLWFFSAQIFNPMLYVWTKSTKIDISLIFCPNPKPLYKQLSGSLSQKHPLTYDVLLVLSVWKDSQKISSVAPFSDLTQRTADAFQNVSLKEIMLEMLCYVLLSVSKARFHLWYLDRRGNDFTSLVLLSPLLNFATSMSFWLSIPKMKFSPLHVRQFSISI
jgi:hypothetical protein